MKKAKSVNKHFNSLRVLTIIAIICTIALTAIILFESGLDGAITRGITESIRNVINEVTGVEDKDMSLAPKSISFTCPRAYFGYPSQLKIQTIPSNANDKFTYKFEDIHGNELDNISIDENNNVIAYLNKPVKEGIYLTITSTLDKNVKYRGVVEYTVLPADDKRIESIDLILSEGWVEIYPTKDEYIKVGKPYYPYCVATIKDEYLEEMGLTKENNRVMLHYTKKIEGLEQTSPSRYLTEDFYIGDSMCFYKPYTFTLTCTLLTKNTPIEITRTLEGIVDPDYDYKPTYLKGSPNSYQDASGKYIDGEYVVQFDKGSSRFVVMAQIQPGKNTQVSIQHYDEHSKECLTIFGNTITRKINRGECYLWMVSDVDKNVREKIKVVFNGDVPTEISFASNQNGMLNSTTLLKAIYDNAQNIYGNDIRYKIIEGEKYATLTEDGKLYGLHLGKVTVRAYSASNPEVYKDMQIEIKLYNDLYYFIRKILGHAFLYAVLGFGFGGVYFMTIKKRWISVIATPASLFAIGGIGELLQSLNPGRSPSWADIAIDFVGGMIGFALVAIVVTIVCLIWRKVNRQSFDNMLIAFKKLNLITIFKRTDKVFATSNETLAENSQSEVENVNIDTSTADCDNISLEEVAADTNEKDGEYA